MNSKYKKIIIILICGIIFGSIIYGHVPAWTGDQYGTLVVSQNIIQKHTLNLNAVKKYWKISSGHYNYQIYVNKSINKTTYAYPLGTPIISVPFVYLANLFGLNMLKNEQLIQEIICSIVAVLIFLTIYNISIQYFSFYFSIILGIFGFYGTTVGPVIGTGLWDLDYDILFSGLAILLIFLSIKKNYSLKIYNSEISSLLVGLFLFLSFISRETAAFLIFFILIFLFVYNRKYFIKTAITSGSLFIIYEIMLFKLTGLILNKGYSLSQFGLKNFKTALKGFFISPARGVLIFDSFLIFTLLGLFFLFKARQRIDKKIKLFIGLILVSSFALSILLLFWKQWFGGGGATYGPRIYADAIYWCFISTIIIWGEITSSHFIIITKKASAKIIIASFLFIGFFINLQGIFNKYAFEWNSFPPNLNKYNKALFDWRFPQFLMNRYNIQEKYRVEGIEFSILKSPQTIFDKEYSAVQSYFRSGGSISKLNAKILEDRSYLPKSYGVGNKPYNWTNNGGWIGSWSPAGYYAIGIMGSCHVILSIIKKYKSTVSNGAVFVFFPYPKAFSGKCVSNNKFGQLLVRFKLNLNSKDEIDISSLKK